MKAGESDRLLDENFIVRNKNVRNTARMCKILLLMSVRRNLKTYYTGVTPVILPAGRRYHMVINDRFARATARI